MVFDCTGKAGWGAGLGEAAMECELPQLPIVGHGGSESLEHTLLIRRERERDGLSCVLAGPFFLTQIPCIPAPGDHMHVSDLKVRN